MIVPMKHATVLCMARDRDKAAEAEAFIERITEEFLSE